MTRNAGYLGIARTMPAHGFLVSVNQMNSLSSGKNLALCGLWVLIGYTLIQDLFAAADLDGCVSARLVVRNIRANWCEGLSIAR